MDDKPIRALASYIQRDMLGAMRNPDRYELTVYSGCVRVTMDAAVPVGARRCRRHRQPARAIHRPGGPTLGRPSHPGRHREALERIPRRLTRRGAILPASFAAVLQLPRRGRARARRRGGRSTAGPIHAPGRGRRSGSRADHREQRLAERPNRSGIVGRRDASAHADLSGVGQLRAENVLEYRVAMATPAARPVRRCAGAAATTSSRTAHAASTSVATRSASLAVAGWVSTDAAVLGAPKSVVASPLASSITPKDSMPRTAGNRNPAVTATGPYRSA